MKRFIKNYYFLPAIMLFALVSVVAVRCKKPTEGIDVIVNTSGIFHYTGLVQVVDASGNVPGNLSVTVTGANAAAIYGTDGKKTLAAPAGIITFGVHPKMEPTASSPLKFNLVITGTGYLPLIIPVTVSTTQSDQIIKASILNLTVPTAGVSTATTTAAASAGTVTATTSLSTPTAGGGPSSTTVTIPAGTKIQDAAGNTINASSVAVSANNFNTAQQNAVDLFPGGSLVAANISGGSQSTGVFVPAGFVNVDMTAGGTPVKKFSAPVNLSMTLDPSFKDPSTGAALAAGNTLGIYSYDTGTGQWTFEQNATVINNGGNLQVQFSTTHLTIFTAAKLQTVISVLKVGITAAWFNKDIETPIVVTAAIQNGPSYNIYKQTFTLDSLLSFTLDNKLPVPTTSAPILITFASITGQVLGTATLTASTSSFTVTLSQPPTNPDVTLLLRLDCTNAKQKAIVIPPDFYLLFKPTGQSANNYVILGQVQGGTITTNFLAPTTAYDFKAVFGSSAKEVNNHTVAENTAANQTVGGVSFNGTKVPAQNALNIDALCNSLP